MNEWRDLAKSFSYDALAWRLIALSCYLVAFIYVIIALSPSTRSVIGYSVMLLFFFATNFWVISRDKKKIKFLEDKYKDQIT